MKNISILITCLGILSCENEDVEFNAPDIRQFENSISLLDSGQIKQYLHEKYQFQRNAENEFNETNHKEVESKIHNVLFDQLAKARVHYLNEETNQLGAVEQSVYKIAKYTSIPDSITVNMDNRRNGGVDSVWKIENPLPPDVKWNDKTIRFIKLSREERNIIEKQLLICNKWIDDCLDKSKREFLDQYLNINMAHWGGAVNSLTFPIILDVNIPSFPTNEITINFKDHIGSWSMLHLISLDGEIFTKTKWVQGPIE